MSKTYCTRCTEVLHEDQVRWAFDNPYCQDCFDEDYIYCSRCDTLLNRTDAHFNYDDDAYCCECWSEEGDDGSPNNPDVNDNDRELILKLSRNWLLGRRYSKNIIKINQNDFLLPWIRDKVGLVENQIYVFGLNDCEVHQLSASDNLIESVEEFIRSYDLNWKVISGTGFNRLGIAYALRKDQIKDVLKLIKHVTKVKALQPTIITT